MATKSKAIQFHAFYPGADGGNLVYVTSLEGAAEPPKPEETKVIWHSKAFEEQDEKAFIYSGGINEVSFCVRDLRLKSYQDDVGDDVRTRVYDRLAGWHHERGSKPSRIKSTYLIIPTLAFRLTFFAHATNARDVEDLAKIRQGLVDGIRWWQPGACIDDLERAVVFPINRHFEEERWASAKFNACQVKLPSKDFAYKSKHDWWPQCSDCPFDQEVSRRWQAVRDATIDSVPNRKRADILAERQKRKHNEKLIDDGAELRTRWDTSPYNATSE